ncbi:MAG: SDR family oxidoreductase [Actinobacteria bacterium]|nr:SDR family oxidoreductase [Actinomycetota bacterium]
MDVVIAGGHGAVARHLGRMLADRGEHVRGLIRDEGQRGHLERDGVEPVLLDLEAADADAYRGAIAGADAVVFAAGAGAGSGAARKETVDYGAAAKLLTASRDAGVDRYVMISSMGAGDPPPEREGDDVFAVYLRAKAKADRELMASDRAWTVVRPGRLTDEPGGGHVALAAHVERGAIAREDVAAVLAAVLDDDRTVGHVFEVVAGPTSIPAALDALVAGD